MGRSIKLLLLLLILQSGLVVWVNLPGDDDGVFEAGTRLLPPDAAEADTVTIEQPGEPRLRMARKGDRWVLSEQGDFLVSLLKFEQFEDKLLNARRSWPVGRTMAAAKRLKVTPDQFERRIRFLRGADVLGDVFIGSSPGFRKVHARLDGDEHTYAIDFNAFDAPADADRWYDTEVLKMEVGDIARIDMGAYALRAEEDVFQVEGLGEDEESDAEAVRKLVRQVSGVAFREVLGEDGKARFDAGKRVMEYTVELKEGSPVTHTVVSPEEGERYIFKSSGQPHYFEVDRDRFDELRDTGRAQLVKDAESVEDTDSVEDAEPVEGTESVKDAEPVEGTESAEGAGSG